MSSDDNYSIFSSALEITELVLGNEHLQSIYSTVCIVFNTEHLDLLSASGLITRGAL